MANAFNGIYLEGGAAKSLPLSERLITERQGGELGKSIKCFSKVFVYVFPFYRIVLIAWSWFILPPPYKAMHNELLNEGEEFIE